MLRTNLSNARLIVAVTWLLLVAALCAVWLVSWHFFPQWYPKDPVMMQRLFFQKTTGMLLGAVGMIGCLLAFDTVTTGEWLAQIYKTPMACAVVVGAYLYCLAWIFTYA